MKWYIAPNDTEFMEYQQFINDEYHLAYSKSPGYANFIQLAPPEKLPDGTPREYAVIVRDKTGRIAAGARLLVISTPAFPTLSSLSARLFFIPSGDLNAHLKTVTGIPQPTIVEYGRLAIGHQVSLTMKPPALRKLFRGMNAISSEVGADIGVSFMRPFMQKLLSQMGLQFHHLAGTYMNRDDETALREMIACFEIKVPRLMTRLTTPLTLKMIEALSKEEMQALLAGLPDGEQLYFGYVNSFPKAGKLPRTTRPRV